MSTLAPKILTSPAALRTRSGILRPGIRGVVCFAALIALLVGPSGPTWLHMPANPLAKTPPMNLSFGDLHQATQAAGTAGLQHAYFAWLGWLLISVTILAALSWTATGRPLAAAALTIMSPRSSATLRTGAPSTEPTTVATRHSPTRSLTASPCSTTTTSSSPSWPATN